MFITRMKDEHSFFSTIIQYGAILELHSPK